MSTHTPFISILDDEEEEQNYRDDDDKRMENNNNNNTNNDDDEDTLSRKLIEVNKRLEGIEKAMESLRKKRKEAEEEKNTIVGKMLLTKNSKTTKKNATSPSTTTSTSSSSNNQKVPSQGYSLDNFPWSSSLMNTLQTMFGLSSFRPFQKEAINASLSGRDVFIIMPTGGGKSLCYQLPALLCPGITLVISPLLALMQDQVMSLSQKGIKSAMFFSGNSAEEVKSINSELDKIADGNSTKGAKGKSKSVDFNNQPSTLRLLYVTPEKIAKSKRLIAKLVKLHEKSGISRIIVDECHCCSQWGHDFRPDYAALNVLKTRFPGVPLMALTATATPRVCGDVKDMLGMDDCEIFKTSFNRANLFYQVKRKPDSAEEVLDDIASFINETYPGESGIIYCYSRKESQSVAEGLQLRGIRSAFYNAEVSIEERERVHRGWIENKIQVVCATISFGLGIDKQAVRFVIHHTLPKTIEGFLQESGRAGRDGEYSICRIYYKQSDCTRQSTMLAQEGKHLDSLHKMISFCENISQCRRLMLARYLADTTYTVTKCDSMCDNCATNQNRKIIKMDVREHICTILQILSYLDRREEKVTLIQLQEIWRGGAKKKVEGFSFTPCPKDFPIPYRERILSLMLAKNIIKEHFHFTPYSVVSYIKVGDKAWKFDDESKTFELEFEEEGKKRKLSTKGKEKEVKKGEGSSKKPKKKGLQELPDEIKEISDDDSDVVEVTKPFEREWATSTVVNNNNTTTTSNFQDNYDDDFM